jgi:ankyrin repeat protein
MKYFRLLGASALVAVPLSAQAPDSSRPLVWAIQHDDRAAISRLLDSGIKPTITDDAGVPVLLLATLFGDAADVDEMLNRGADPNQTDNVGATALMWAMPDIGKVRRLIARGADVNARSSNLGRTPLLVAAGYPGTVDVLKLLLANGANLHAKDAAGFTALGIAMTSADVEVVRFLVDRGLDVNDAGPAVALRLAYGRPRPAVVQYLNSHGVKLLPDTLLWGAEQSPNVVERWIKAGANVNARTTTYGITPLMRAVSSEMAGTRTVQLLLAAGANVNAESSEGERPLDWAIYRGDRAKIALLEKYGATRGEGPRRQATSPHPRDGNSDARLSVARSVSLLLKSAPPMYEQRRCYTCHHNTVPAEAAALARRKGVQIPEDLARKNLDDIVAVFRSTAGPALQGRENVPGGVALTVGYGLMALAAERHELDSTIASHIHWTLATQMPDGSWLGNGASRPPIEFSTVSHTAIAVRGLALYPIAGRKREFDRAFQNAAKWLTTAPAPTAEERAMRLMGLVWTKANDGVIKAATQAVVREQTASGGWSQLPELEPDAYATGISLVALNEAGIRVSDDVYRTGVNFLLTTQYPDGAWFVRSRAFPIQPYFESGFPFDRHQWISAAGTAWATLAVARTLADTTASSR